MLKREFKKYIILSIIIFVNFACLNTFDSYAKLYEIPIRSSNFTSYYGIVDENGKLYVNEIQDRYDAVDNVRIIEDSITKEQKLFTYTTQDIFKIRKEYNKVKNEDNGHIYEKNDDGSHLAYLYNSDDKEEYYNYVAYSNVGYVPICKIYNVDGTENRKLEEIIGSNTIDYILNNKIYFHNGNDKYYSICDFKTYKLEETNFQKIDAIFDYYFVKTDGGLEIRNEKYDLIKTIDVDNIWAKIKCKGKIYYITKPQHKNISGEYVRVSTFLDSNFNKILDKENIYDFTEHHFAEGGEWEELNKNINGFYSSSMQIIYLANDVYDISDGEYNIDFNFANNKIEKKEKIIKDEFGDEVSKSKIEKLRELNNGKSPYDLGFGYYADLYSNPTKIFSLSSDKVIEKKCRGSAYAFKFYDKIYFTSHSPSYSGAEGYDKIFDEDGKEVDVLTEVIRFSEMLYVGGKTDMFSENGRAQEIKSKYIFGFTKDNTYVLGKDFEVIKKLPRRYYRLKSINEDDKIVYMFSKDEYSDNIKYDLYDNNFNIIDEKLIVEDIYSNDNLLKCKKGKTYLAIKYKKNSQSKIEDEKIFVYDEKEKKYVIDDSGLVLWDLKLDGLNKDVYLKRVYSENKDTQIVRFDFYDKKGKIIFKNIKEYIWEKYDNWQSKYLMITDDKSTKLYDKNLHLKKDFKDCYRFMIKGSDENYFNALYGIKNDDTTFYYSFLNEAKTIEGVTDNDFNIVSKKPYSIYNSSKKVDVWMGDKCIISDKFDVVLIDENGEEILRTPGFGMYSGENPLNILKAKLREKALNNDLNAAIEIVSGKVPGGWNPRSRNVADDVININYDFDGSILKNPEKYDNQEIKEIANDAFVFIVNKDNDIDNISSEDIRNIYAEKITNWKELGGKDMNILPFQKDKNDIAQEMFSNNFVKDSKLEKVEPFKVMDFDGEGYLNSAIALYDNEDNAIGFGIYSYLHGLMKCEEKNMKILSIDGVMPNEENIRSGKYPYTVKVFATIGKTAGDYSEARRMYDYIIGDKGETLLNKNGFVVINK